MWRTRTGRPASVSTRSTGNRPKRPMTPIFTGEMESSRPGGLPVPRSESVLPRAAQSTCPSNRPMASRSDRRARMTSELVRRSAMMTGGRARPAPANTWLRMPAR